MIARSLPTSAPASFIGRIVASLSIAAAGCSLTPLDGLGGSSGDGAGGASSAATSTSASSGNGASGGSVVGGSGTGGLEPPSEVTIDAAPGLDGDGFLSWPPPGLCGETVTDWYPRDPYKVIDVGRDPPCDVDVSYRAFVRFDISTLPRRSPTSARFFFFYLQKQYPTAGVHLFRVDDAGPISDIYWNAANHAALGQVLTPATLEVQWIEVDVLPALVEVIDTGASFLVLKFQYDDEEEAPAGLSRWYDIVSADSETDQHPRLILGY